MAAVSLKNCIYPHKKEKPKLKKYTNIFDISWQGEWGTLTQFFYFSTPSQVRMELNYFLYGKWQL